MNNTQAAQAARQIPFNPQQPLPPDVKAGLKRIVAKQLRHLNYRVPGGWTGATR